MSGTVLEVLEENISLVAHKILSQAHSSQLIFFQGEPGAGKTTLINALLKQLDLEQSASPTFALHNRIIGLNKKVDHFDLYRIESVDELETTGIWDVISEFQTGIKSGEQKHYILIEWANKFDSNIWPIELPQIVVQISNGQQMNSRVYRVQAS